MKYSKKTIAVGLFMTVIAIITLIGFLAALYLSRQNQDNRNQAYQCPESNPDCDTTFQADACLLYGIHDAGEADTQFFTIDPKTLVVSPLGPVIPRANIEGLDIHPQTGEIFGSVGSKHAFERGTIHKVNPSTGEITLIGNTGFDKSMPSLSFKDTDGTLWGWANNVGLIEIDTATAKGSVKFENKDLSVDSIAWNQTGSILYLTVGKDLWKLEGTDLKKNS